MQLADRNAVAARLRSAGYDADCCSMTGVITIGLPDYAAQAAVGDVDGPWEFAITKADGSVPVRTVIGVMLHPDELYAHILQFIARFDPRWLALLDRAEQLLRPLESMPVEGPRDCEVVDRVREALKLIVDLKGGDVTIG